MKVYVLVDDVVRRPVAVVTSLEAAQGREPGEWWERHFELSPTWESNTHSVYEMEVEQ